MSFRLFLTVFDLSILPILKTCFYWRLINESNFISNLNHLNLTSNEKFMLEISIVGLSWVIENDSVMQVVLTKIDISYHWIFKTCFYWRYTFELALIWIWNHSISTKNKEIVIKTLQVSMIGRCSPAGNK